MTQSNKIPTSAQLSNRRKTKKWTLANPEKKRVQHMIYNEVRYGRLPRVSTKKCVDCGKTAAAYHHEDYSKPFDVTPLCRKCHQGRHFTGKSQMINDNRIRNEGDNGI